MISLGAKDKKRYAFGTLCHSGFDVSNQEIASLKKHSNMKKYLEADRVLEHQRVLTSNNQTLELSTAS